MSSTPRSSLKKRSGNHDDRRVSFATPLSTDKVTSGEKQLAAKANQPLKKKAKSTDELADLTALANQQSEVIEEVFEIESKFSKHSALSQDLTIELASFMKLIANLSADQAKVKSRIEDQSQKFGVLENKKEGLISQAHIACTKFEARKTARSQYSVGLVELHAAIGFINCTNIEDAEEPIADYDKVLDMIDKLESLVDSF